MYRYLHEDHHFSLSEYDLEHGQAEICGLWARVRMYRSRTISPRDTLSKVNQPQRVTSANRI